MRWGYMLQVVNHGLFLLKLTMLLQIIGSVCSIYYLLLNILLKYTVPSIKYALKFFRPKVLPFGLNNSAMINYSLKMFIYSSLPNLRFGLVVLSFVRIRLNL